MNKHYKIKDMTTGLFSTGGNYPTWSTRGKVWSSLGTLKAHITRYSKYRKGVVPVTWEVVEYILTEGDKFPAAALQKKREK